MKPLRTLVPLPRATPDKGLPASGAGGVGWDMCIAGGLLPHELSLHEAVSPAQNATPPPRQQPAFSHQQIAHSLPGPGPAPHGPRFPTNARSHVTSANTRTTSSTVPPRVLLWESDPLKGLCYHLILESEVTEKASSQKEKKIQVAFALYPISFLGCLKDRDGKPVLKQKLLAPRGT